MPTSRIWLRLELFELGVLVFPSKYAATLTVANVKRSLDALHARFEAAKAAADGDAEMTDASSASELTTGFTESDNLNRVTYVARSALARRRLLQGLTHCELIIYHHDSAH